MENTRSTKWETYLNAETLHGKYKEVLGETCSQILQYHFIADRNI
jgi:hypothetical protein